MASKVSYFTLKHAGRTLLLREHGLIPHSATGSRRAPPRRCTTAQAGAIPALAPSMRQAQVASHSFKPPDTFAARPQGAKPQAMRPGRGSHRLLAPSAFVAVLRRLTCSTRVSGCQAAHTSTLFRTAGRKLRRLNKERGRGCQAPSLKSL